MLVPLFAATDGSDPLRPGGDDVPERQDDAYSTGDPPPSEPPQRDPPPEEAPLYDPPAEPDMSAPPESQPVALVPSVSDPDGATPEPEAVETAMRGTEAPSADVEPDAEKRSPVQRFALAVLLIAAAALIGYAVSRPSGSDDNPDTLARSVEAARSLQFVLDTEDPVEARRFVRNEFGWRVGVPVFPTLTLHGLAVAEVAPAVEVPVLLYRDGDARDLAVFVYSYALLDQVPERLTLSQEDFADLAHGEPALRRTDDTDVVLWRDRDDIYIAVTERYDASLIGGMTMAR